MAKQTSPTLVTGLLVDHQMYLNATQLALWALKSGYPGVSAEIERIAEVLRKKVQ